MSSENNNKKRYSDEDISVLKIVDAIRESPGMYIGSSDKQGFHHLINEVLENSADEASMGDNEIIVKISLSDDKRTVTVEDNGRGIPMSINPFSGVSSLQTVFTFAHSGAKFKKAEGASVYGASGGMHGIGLTAVNALSEKLEVVSKRDNSLGRIIFKEGEIIFSEQKENISEETGVKIEFTPDSNIFKDQFDNIVYFDPELIEKRAEELSRLNKKLTFLFKKDSSSLEKKFHYEDGLFGWIKDLNYDIGLDDTKICNVTWNNPINQDYLFLDFAFQYTKERKYNIFSFCNSISTISGGTHQDGFEAGIVKACKTWIEKKYPKYNNLTKEDITSGLTAIVSVNMQGQVFSGQTKDKLTNPKIRELIKNATSNSILDFFQDNALDAEIISKKLITHAQNRIKLEQQQNILKSLKQNFILPEKVADCISKDPEKRTIFLVEGDSAAGSAKLARNVNFQAVISVKGKVINAEKKDTEAFKNEEISNLTRVLGYRPEEIINNYYNLYRDKLSLNEEEFSKERIIIKEDFVYKDELGTERIIFSNKKLSFDEVKVLVNETKRKLISKLRYWKIVIMADADTDGKHIECLIITFFAKYFFFLIEEHHLFLAICPLYEIKTNKGYDYLYNKSELEEYSIKNKNKNFFIHRLKGLGEMDPQKLRDTTMKDSDISCLHSIIYHDYKHVYSVIDQLMGIKSDYRKKYLEEGTYRDATLIVNDNKLEITHALFLKFLAYAHEVVEMRAIPQIQDGFKIVQRRIIYALHELKVYSDKQHIKSVKAIGEVMGKYHPHGDQSIYQAMIKMTQTFNYRYPLIDGKGNWGSLDGDSAAASRYTEIRLSPLVSQYLKYLPYNTVEMIDNYDGREKEPLLLPANLNLLLNGANGVAVGMNTNIPPHHLAELVDTVISLINNPNLETRDLFSTFKGPDFPTGGIILEKDKLIDFYEKGEGTIYVRAKANFIVNSKSNGKRENLILITSIPFRANKSEIVKQIKSKEIKGLRSVYDLSNLENPVNIQCSVDPNYDSSVILNELFRTTDLQTSYSMKLRALINGKPKILNLKEILFNFIITSLEHIDDKAKFTREKNEKELVNLQIRNLIIKKYENIAEISKEQKLSESEKFTKLVELFSLEIKSLPLNEKEFVDKILDTQTNFRQFLPEKLIDLEQKIFNLKSENDNLTNLISDPKLKKQILIEDLKELKKKYSFDFRRTEFSDENHHIDERNLTPAEDRLVVFSTSEGDDKINSYLNMYSANLDVNSVTSQGKLLKSRGNNLSILKVKRTQDCLLFTNYGKVYCLNFYKFSSINKSTNIREEYGFNLFKDEYPVCFLPIYLDDFNPDLKKKIVLVTNKGKIKIITLSKLSKLNNSGKKVINFYKKELKKCLLHEEAIKNHKYDNCCDKLLGVYSFLKCDKFKLIMEEIKKCSNCVIVDKEKKRDDFISKVSLFSENTHEVEVVFEKQYEGSTKNFRTPIHFKSRKLDENGKKIYCSLHASQIEKHKLFHDCNYLSCEDLKNIIKSIGVCNDCQKPTLFVKKIRNTVKNCNRVIDIININKQEYLNKEDLRIALLREDGTLLKKTWSETNYNLGKNDTAKRIKNCEKHWNELIFLKEEKKQLLIKLRESKTDLKNYITNSDLDDVKKEKYFSNLNFLYDSDKYFGAIDSKLIDNFDINDNSDNFSLSNRILEIKNKLRSISDYFQKIELNNSSLEKLKHEISKCKICIGNCNKHYKKLESHKLDNCCDKTKGLEAYLGCSKFKQLTKDISDCLLCKDIVSKRHIISYFNPINRAFLFNKKEKYLFYILSESYFSLYGKDDFLDFVNRDKRRSVRVYKASKKIVDATLKNINF